MSDTADPMWWLILALGIAALLLAWALASIPVAALVCAVIARRDADDEMTAADWAEPTRAQVEWETHLAEAIRLTEEDEAADQAWAELPIYRATAAHIARFAAEDIDRDWAEMNGGAS